MIASNGYNQYVQNSINTARPEDLTLMLYNGIIKFIMQAQIAVEEKDIEKANNSINRSQDIIQELQCTLDMNYEVSHNLASIYDYLYRRLIDANVKKDKEILEEVLGFAKELRDTWAQAMKLAKHQGSLKQVAT